MFGDDRWRDTYDNWKLASPYDEYPEECWHEEYEADINGRAVCSCCGETWYLTAAEIESEREASVAFDRAMRREEWRQFLSSIISRIAFWRRWTRHTEIDDEIPF